MLQQPYRGLNRAWALTLLAALVVILALPMQALAWANGQPAARVLGQANFTTGSSALGVNGLSGPAGLVVDPTSMKLFVTDSGNNRVLRFANLQALSNWEPAEAVLGQPSFGSAGAAATQSGMYGPMGLAIDGNGRLWVADTRNNRVLRFDNAANKATGANADAVLGQATFTGAAPALTQTGMNWPFAVAVDPLGVLWVADKNNDRVLRFDAAASKPNGAPAGGVLGQADFTSSFPPNPSLKNLFNPQGLAVDGNGHLWVADYRYHRVVRFDNAASKANGADADGVLGQPDLVTYVYAGTTQARMNSPLGLMLDGSGRLWVADMGNNRVLRFDNAAAKADGANADGVLGQPSYTSAGTALTDSGINTPISVAADPLGRVWVADGWNNRVLLFRGPQVAGITRAEASPTTNREVKFRVSFDSSVFGVSASNFSLSTSGSLAGKSITKVEGSGTDWYITAKATSGEGDLRLEMVNSNGVQDAYANGVLSLPTNGSPAFTIFYANHLYLPSLTR